MTYLAHGIGGRADLPAPLWLTLYAGGTAVIVTFLALLAFWTRQRYARGAEVSTDRIHPVRPGLIAARIAGMVVWIATVAVGILGSSDATKSPVPTWFWVWFWVGLAPISVLFGPVWRWMNPLRTVISVIRGALGVHPARPIPPRWGIWPAVGSLSVFLWFELVFDRSDHPGVIVAFIIGYSAVIVAGGIRYGPDWCSRADGFEVYSTLFGYLSPIWRRPNGRLGLRNPLRRLATVPRTPGVAAFTCLVLGATAFDGLSRHGIWRNLVADVTRTPRILIGTAGLTITVCTVLATYLLATRSAEPHLRVGADLRLDRELAHSLLPIALGYSVAHYFSFAVFQGQAGYLLATDPLGRGWNLLGLHSTQINYAVLSATTIATVQICGVVIGHILGVIAAHDRAIGLFPRSVRIRGQYALLTVMVGYTVGGLALVAGT